MHVPGLKNNLVSVCMLEDLRYFVLFSGGKVFLHHKATTQVNNIRVHVKKHYKIDVDGCTTLSSKVGKVVSRDTSELWNRRLGHQHHSALRIMQHISTGLPRCTLVQIDT